MQNRTARPLLKVHHWRGSGSLSADAFRVGTSPLVLCIATPDTTNRDMARELARKALREALGVLLERPPEEVRLISRPGHPIRLAPSGPRIGLSLSHEPGLTLAAIHPEAAIGIDLMRVDQRSGWLSDWEPVARDYLGRQAADSIARQPLANRAHAFARAWTSLEAGLKCHEMPLQEWDPTVEHKLMRCRLFDLDLPDAFIGTLAVHS